MKHTLLNKKLLRISVLVAVTIVFSFVTSALANGVPAALPTSLLTGTQTEFQVAYKLDPRLTGGIHIGDRWVSPPLYDVISEGRTYTIEARAQVEDPYSGPMTISADWVSSNPGLVAVSPLQDDIVALKLSGQGKTSVQVTGEGASKTLYLSAAFYNSQCVNLRVMVSQTSQPELPAQTCRVMLPLMVH